MDIQGKYIDPEKEEKKARPPSHVNNHICGDTFFFLVTYLVTILIPVLNNCVVQLKIRRNVFVTCMKELF